MPPRNRAERAFHETINRGVTTHEEAAMAAAMAAFALQQHAPQPPALQPPANQMALQNPALPILGNILPLPQPQGLRGQWSIRFWFMLEWFLQLARLIIYGYNYWVLIEGVLDVSHLFAGGPPAMSESPMTVPTANDSWVKWTGWGLIAAALCTAYGSHLGVAAFQGTTYIVTVGLPALWAYIRARRQG